MKDTRERDRRIVKRSYGPAAWRTAGAYAASGVIFFLLPIIVPAMSEVTRRPGAAVPQFPEWLAAAAWIPAGVLGLVALIVLGRWLWASRQLKRMPLDRRMPATEGVIDTLEQQKRCAEAALAQLEMKTER